MWFRKSSKLWRSKIDQPLGKFSPPPPRAPCGFGKATSFGAAKSISRWGKAKALARADRSSSPVLREHGGLKSLVPPPLPGSVSRRRQFFAERNRAPAGEICARGDGNGFEQTDNLELETDWPVSFQFRLSLVAISFLGFFEALSFLTRARRKQRYAIR